MSYNYTSFEQLALRQIKDKGQAMVLQTQAATSDTVVPGADTPTTTDPKDYPCTGVMLTVKPNEFAGDSMVRSKMRKVLIAAAGIAVVPVEGNLLRVQKDVFSVLSVDTLKPGDTAILHTLLVQR